jgi:hypothetical protein
MFEYEAKEGSWELELDFEFSVSEAILTFFSITYNPFLHHREHSAPVLEIPNVVQCSVQKIAQSVVNNHTYLFSSYMFRLLRDHHQGGIYRAKQIQLTLSKMCMCVEVKYTLFIKIASTVYTVSQQMDCSESLLISYSSYMFRLCTSSSGSLLLRVLLSYIKDVYGFIIC